MTFGGAALLSGIAITLAALSYGSVAVFFLGSAVTGLGFGAGFQAAVRSVVPLAAPDERAGVLSVVFIVSYIAMGLPAVIAGVLIVEQGNIVLTAKEFGGVVMALAALALLGTLRRSSATAYDDDTETTKLPLFAAREPITIAPARAAQNNVECIGARGRTVSFM